ncbi:uncharacterized protein PADG_05978 [Paracoccidioides brasiliensis Pb18]|uniref:Major facilitator superfamily (MFS) profile domain-containing protein n=1 Tax=Paracoccidioides brasiliensis (strain Pb18) TaxID=502780 RepID=C1GFE2_PARBD|nr:uncharacterized protein PADG_05978 [Paracoccidioides brasiliensis Pb18]EEH49899.2 hypothetical protein PADG_05978 [Paracoccidioides brasiliensis Pb18]
MAITANESLTLTGMPPENVEKQPLPSPVPEKPKKSAAFFLTVFWLCLVSVITSLDSVIITAILPSIARDLPGTTVQLFWCGTGFLLAQTVTIPLYGSFSDIFGRKWALNLALTIFTLGSILCATAKHMQWLVAARAIKGLGAGGNLSLVSVIISDITTLQERGSYISLVSLAWAVGTIAGVPIGGAIGERTSWRWSFWINVPICVVSIIGLTISLRLKTATTTLTAKIARIDFPGIIVFVGSTTSFLLGLTTGGTIHPWDSANVLVPLIVGVAGWGLFIFVELKYAREPMIPLRVFHDRTAATGGYSSVFFHGLVLWCLSYYIIIFFLGVTQHSLLHSAVETLPGTAFIAPFSITAGILMTKTLRFQKIIWAGWAIMTVGTGLNALLKPHSTGGILYGVRIIMPIGAGLLFPTTVVAVQSVQKGEDVGIATSVQVFARSLGQAFGVALGAVIFQNEFDRFVRRAVAAGGLVARNPLMLIPGSQADAAFDIIKTFPESVQEIYRFVYANSLRTVWYVITGISGFALLVSLAMRDESLNKDAKGRHQFDHEGKDGRVVDGDGDGDGDGPGERDVKRERLENDDGVNGSSVATTVG